MQALIVDDERHCREGLAIMLAKYCPGVEVLAQCPDARTALKAIGKYQPDLIFLDIEMPVMNGFDMLERCKEYDLEIIFTTAYNEYAIQAIRRSAIDYLLKPVSKNELIEAVNRATEARKNKALPEGPPLRSRIALPTIDGLILLDLKDVIYCEAENNYTRFHLSGGDSVYVSKTLRKVEDLLLDNPDFFRIHHSFIVNLKYVQRYFRGDGGEINLATGLRIPVSRAKKQEFLDRLERL
ncbi:LytR/AlgR family response regulator transcription factor [Dinghuibacter silviterrae]|uniref:LytTR family two component transcriptional regulator n=1 Tax=Dinghuibacter silviterrae TaxID=1539049 RepID=A0A4R8DI01_9BACT|nr:LytTR family DNA-binding domain-containing protein [Dinghuibacter silviterrae]TDW97363.1 LytTR family two component transcriptional regulator [Dinghuibacter silviterrae]